MPFAKQHGNNATSIMQLYCLLPWGLVTIFVLWNKVGCAPTWGWQLQLKVQGLATQLDDAHFLSSGASIIQSLTKLLLNRLWYISIIMGKSCKVHMWSMQLQSSKARHNWEITVYAQTLVIIKLSTSKTAAIYLYISSLGARPLRLPAQAQGQLLLLASQSFSSRISVPQQNSCNWWDSDLWNLLLE